jgi:circadian clock protein KaiC
MAVEALDKAPSGVAGLDEVTRGGLPRGRSTLLCGGAGCGKTLLGMQFLVSGATEDGEPGVFLCFEETAEDLRANVASLGWDLPGLESSGLLIVDHVRVEPAEIEEAGQYGLDGLMIRLEAAIAEIGAKRVVLDTLEVLFGALHDGSVLRAELRRLFRWLKDQGITAIVTSERGEGQLTRHGLEEYVSDCVILLDHRVSAQVSTRRLRVVKYRGSAHDPDEVPFLIERDGFRVMPVSSLRLEHEATLERVSSGVERLDAMLAGEGYYRGASILVSGTPGSGKTTLGASFLDASCRAGEKAMLLALEESPQQYLRNMRSVGIDLQPHLDSGLLRMTATRPSVRGLEEHLAIIYHDLAEFEPGVMVVDPLSAFTEDGQDRPGMLTRLVDLLKSRGVTALYTSLITREGDVSGLGISSVIDTWIALEAVEHNGERNRSLSIVKARGTGHSNQVREFVISATGVELVDVYTGAGQVFLGTARRVREARDEAARVSREQLTDAKRRRIEHRRAEVEGQIAALRAGLDAEVEALELEVSEAEEAERQLTEDRDVMATARRADEHE